MLKKRYYTINWVHLIDYKLFYTRLRLIQCGGKYYYAGRRAVGPKSTKCMVRLVRGPPEIMQVPSTGHQKKANQRRLCGGNMQEQPIFNLLIVH